MPPQQQQRPDPGGGRRPGELTRNSSGTSPARAGSRDNNSSSSKQAGSAQKTLKDSSEAVKYKSYSKDADPLLLAKVCASTSHGQLRISWNSCNRCALSTCAALLFLLLHAAVEA